MCIKIALFPIINQNLHAETNDSLASPLHLWFTCGVCDIKQQKYLSHAMWPDPELITIWNASTLFYSGLAYPTRDSKAGSQTDTKELIHLLMVAVRSCHSGTKTLNTVLGQGWALPRKDVPLLFWMCPRCLKNVQRKLARHCGTSHL